MSAIIQPSGSGGGGFDPASPGAIGGTTPGAGNFSSLKVGSGATISSVLIGGGSISTDSVAGGTNAQKDFAVTGVAAGDYALVSFESGIGAQMVLASVFLTSNTVSLIFQNTSDSVGSSLSGTNAHILVIKAS